MMTLQKALHLCALLCVLCCAACQSQAPSANNIIEDGAMLAVTLREQPFRLQLNLSQDSRHKGMGGLKSIDEDFGMLFVHPTETTRTYVMRDCHFPIDIAYINRTGRIVAMHTMAVEPADTPDYKLKRYKSRYPAQLVLELKAGMLNELSLKVNDQLDLPIEKLIESAK